MTDSSAKWCHNAQTTRQMLPQQLDWTGKDQPHWQASTWTCWMTRYKSIQKLETARPQQLHVLIGNKNSTFKQLFFRVESVSMYHLKTTGDTEFCTKTGRLMRSVMCPYCRTRWFEHTLELLRRVWLALHKKSTDLRSLQCFQTEESENMIANSCSQLVCAAACNPTES